MKHLFAYLRLVRWLNLVFVGATLCFVQYTIVVPFLYRAGLEATLDSVHFLLLVLSTILIAAAGYIINDYFDIQIDEINKPRSIVIDRQVPRRLAMMLHQVLTGAGILLGMYVAHHAGYLRLVLIHVIVAAFLWFYSTGYKRKLFVGNLVVSLLTAFVVLLPALYERNLFTGQNPAVDSAAYSIFIILFFYFLFALIVSLARELIKDVEDLEGDRRQRAVTVPIVAGIATTKWIVAALLLFALLLSVYVQVLEVRGSDEASAVYIFATVQFPLLMLMAGLLRAEEPKQFRSLSLLLKVLMFMGILSMVYFYFLMN